MKTSNRLIALCSLLAALLAGLSRSVAEFPPGWLANQEDQFQYRRILVKPRQGLAVAEAAQVTALRQTTRGTLRAEYPGIGGLQVIEFATNEDARTALTRYLNSGLMEYAEPDAKLFTFATPNDAKFTNQWSLNNTGQTGGTSDADIDAPEAWDIQSAATNIVVAVVDSGMRLTHEDLADNLWVNSGEIAGNGIDDDHNGIVDDVHGFNAITGSGNPDDDYGHGTHVAGIIGARENRSTRI